MTAVRRLYLYHSRQPCAVSQATHANQTRITCVMGIFRQLPSAWFPSPRSGSRNPRNPMMSGTHQPCRNTSQRNTNTDVAIRGGNWSTIRANAPKRVSRTITFDITNQTTTPHHVAPIATQTYREVLTLDLVSHSRLGVPFETWCPILDSVSHSRR